MCTVSIIPRTDGQAGIRIVFNRDEQRSRPAAEAPREHRLGQRRILLPRDPASGGTWIAASDAGVVLMLLNVNDAVGDRRAHSVSQRRSRGLIIPSLVHLGSVDAMIQRCLHHRGVDFEPFRLLLASTGGCIELRSDGAAIRCQGGVLPGRVAMFTSSGLGDQLVEAPRRRLFDALLGDGLHCNERQDAFHRHQWLDLPHMSVWMSRADACTVSRTVIELMENQIVMRYAALDERGIEIESPIHRLPVRDDAATALSCIDPEPTSADTPMLQGVPE